MQQFHIVFTTWYIISDKILNFSFFLSLFLQTYFQPFDVT